MPHQRSQWQLRVCRKTEEHIYHLPISNFYQSKTNQSTQPCTTTKRNGGKMKSYQESFESACIAYKITVSFLFFGFVFLFFFLVRTSTMQNVRKCYFSSIVWGSRQQYPILFLSLGMRKQRWDREVEESQGWKQKDRAAGFDDAITLWEIIGGARNSNHLLLLLSSLPLYLTLGTHIQTLGSGMKLSHSENKI